MASCEKCWSGSFMLAAVSGRPQAEVYRELIERSNCTPEEQCGEMHLVLEWKDSKPMCRCEHAKLEGR